MHIPDGVLDTKTLVTTSVLGAGAVSYSLYQARTQLTAEKVKQMAAIGAFIFAAQMINIPITGGTSGHLLGAALAAILLGPWLGMLTLSLVLTIQCLLFADGGFLALGANIFCAAAVSVMAGYLVHVWLKDKVHQLISSFIAGWFSLLAGAASIGLALVWSNGTSFMYTMQAMLSVHSLIGVIEASLTAAVVFAATYKVREQQVLNVKG